VFSLPPDDFLLGVGLVALIQHRLDSINGRAVIGTYIGDFIGPVLYILRGAWFKAGTFAQKVRIMYQQSRGTDSRVSLPRSRPCYCRLLQLETNSFMCLVKSKVVKSLVCWSFKSRLSCVQSSGSFVWQRKILHSAYLIAPATERGRKESPF